MSNLSLISLWNTTRKQNSQINYHAHKYHELVYYTSGNGKTKIGGKTFFFTGHHFAVIPAHTEHNETHYADSDVICLEFASSDDLPIGFYADQNHIFHSVLTLLLNEIREQKRGYEDMLTLQLNVLLLHLLRLQNGAAATKDFSYIINFISENYHERISLAACAQELNLSYDYFQHKFKSVTGYSPQQFLMEQRLLGAEKMLQEGTYTCTEIAYRCGFCTSAQFSKLFKTSRGMTPMQYKKLYKNRVDQ